jgi:hypothetical protein
MKEITEQEQLAQLIGIKEDLDPVVTGDILADGLRAKLGGVMNISQSHHEDSDEKTSDNEENSIKVSIVLSVFYDLHDNLINLFTLCDIKSEMASLLTKQINKIESYIVNLGGSIEKFNALDYVSGLTIPNTIKNAQSVVAMTKQCYRLGTITDAKVSDDGKEINIVFSGSDGDTEYVAYGRIIADTWIGNEAIDYIYTPNSGKMSVKSFSNGRWIEKKYSDGYNISWELSEENKSEKYGKMSNNKKEAQIDSANDGCEDINSEEDIGAPIN